MSVLTRNFSEKNHLTKSHRKLLKPKAEKRLIAFLFLLPAIICFILFVYYPFFNTIYNSFFRYNFVNPSNSIFVGFNNYINTFKSQLFWLEIKNTLILFLFQILFGFWVPILQAIAISEMIRGKGFARLAYLLPTALSAFAGLSVWKYIWEPDGGLANMITKFLGLGAYQWYGDENLVKFCLRFPAILGGGGMVIIIFVAINNISSELYEAAKIDGANAFQRIRHITMPGIKYIVFLTFILGLTGSLLAFTDVYMITQGGPGYSSFTVVLGIYTKAFREQNFGMAMAMSVVLCLMTLIITAFTFYVQGRLEED